MVTATKGFTGWGQPVCAVGQLSAQTATIGAEKELAQLTAGEHQGDQIEVDLLREVLSRPENAYLGWYLSWVFTSGGVDAFTVVPRNDADVTRLAEMLSPVESEDLVHIIVGKTVPSPVDSPSAVSALPSVQADQLLAFTLAEFAAAMPDGAADGENAPARARKTGRDDFETLVRRVFLRLTNGAALPGFADEERGRGYVAHKYSGFFQAVAQAHRDGKALMGVHARHVHSTDRRLVSVGFTVRNRQTDITERYECLVDVTEPLIFLAAGLRLVYD
jgi:hypothetical protein